MLFPLLSGMNWMTTSPKDEFRSHPSPPVGSLKEALKSYWMDFCFFFHICCICDRQLCVVQRDFIYTVVISIFSFNDFWPGFQGVICFLFCLTCVQISCLCNTSIQNYLMQVQINTIVQMGQQWIVNITVEHTVAQCYSLSKNPSNITNLFKLPHLLKMYLIVKRCCSHNYYY